MSFELLPPPMFLHFTHNEGEGHIYVKPSDIKLFGRKKLTPGLQMYSNFIELNSGQVYEVDQSLEELSKMLFPTYIAPKGTTI